MQNLNTRRGLQRSLTDFFFFFFKLLIPFFFFFNTEIIENPISLCHPLLCG